MTAESDIRPLELDVHDLAGAVKDLACIVERMLKGTSKSTDANGARRAAGTASHIASNTA